MRTHSISRFCRTGFWFCERCERIVQIPDDAESPARCPRCKKPFAVFTPPIFYENDPELRQRDHLPLH